MSDEKVAMSRENLKGILQEDDASKYLDALPEEQRRPQYIQNGLLTSPESFSDDEKKVGADRDEEALERAFKKIAPKPPKEQQNRS